MRCRNSLIVRGKFPARVRRFPCSGPGKPAGCPSKSLYGIEKLDRIRRRAEQISLPQGISSGRSRIAIQRAHDPVISTIAHPSGIGSIRLAAKSVARCEAERPGMLRETHSHNGSLWSLDDPSRGNRLDRSQTT
jgi:hypothetical protein